MFRRAHGERRRELPIALVVEDEWLVRLELVEALDSGGWTVVEASTGEAALLLLKSDPPIDLVVTDIRLPGDISGWDIAEAFRAQNSAIAVIYCSGNPSNPARQVANSVFLSKPCLTELLLETGRQLCPSAPPRRPA
jgi:CheY-like chemotaxis protein